MKYFILIIAMLLTAVSAHAASNVNVSVAVGQPGFYGQIDIGNAPRPALIYPEPVVIRPAPVHVVQEPLYLHVPPGHAKHWSKHCSRYNACNRPVYFVHDNWYNKVYVPHYKSHRHYYDQRRHGHGGKHGKDDRHGRDDHGNGHGHGKH